MTTTHKIGITQIILGNASLDETLNLCEDAGYEAVELTFRDGKDLHPNMTDSELADAARRCADAGVEIASVISASPKGGGGNLLSTDPDQREHGVLRVRRSCEIAEALGAGATLLHPGALPQEGTYDDAWNALCGSLKELAPVAEESQCAVGVENVWNKFLLSPREMRQLIDEVGSEWIGAYLDTANMMAYGYTEQWIRALGTRIKRVHFKDFKRGPHAWTRLMDGDTDWAGVMAELRAAGYSAPVIHEVGGSRDDHIETARRMRRIVAL